HNSVVTEKLGYPAEHLVGKPVLFVHPEDRHEEVRAVIGAILAGEADTCPIPLKTRDGRLIPVETKVVSGHWRGSNAIIGICRDISERLELERRIRQSEKAESLNRMAGAIAHHFNNQLQVVMGNLELAIGDLPMGGGTADSLLTAMNGAQRAARVSSQILTYIGQTPSKRSHLNLSELCRLGLPLIEATMPKNIVLDTDLPVHGPVVLANANQIQEILTHLVTNAREAMDDSGGVICLGVRTAPAGDISATHRFPIDWQPQDKMYACLEVKDSGPGIGEQDMERLFDPFFSTKFTGRGMGLSVVLGIVRAHGGAITVESRVGQKIPVLQCTESVEGQAGGWSVLRIYLPLSAEEVVRPAEKAFGVPELTGGGTVLVIDDEPQLRELARRMIMNLGFDVLTAEDGIEGVAVFREHQDRIRLVLTDLTMPRMDGWATLAALRELKPDIPVILSSGYSEASVMSDDHAKMSPQAFLSKPYNLKSLREAIARAAIVIMSPPISGDLDIHSERT
ncbi:MAG: response regulator, partial [Desulfatirhabdiaceae bacterium]